MSPVVHWKRLVRYIAEDGIVRLGEPKVGTDSFDILKLAREGNLTVEILEGSSVLSAKPTGGEEKVESLLAPLAVKEVPFVRCIGLNYKTHILETGRPLPTCPTIFSKPATVIAGPTEDVPIPRIAQGQCDYEGELTILIGKDAKNVSEEDALDYVAAYTVGNDVSARDWQREPEKAGPIPQWTFSKSFDNQGQTLQAGSLIMTGTPGGVGLFMKPPRFLKQDDEVTVEIEGTGRISNTIQFE
ncbi:hypothetical protein LTR37_013558 [Vermiconidia calcicola]|uniref:Uncharacterized protein n=1 Tax=Vermiconidia calcicola TaxID=1690605 RepID=A0ACC3MXK8_9PEZI|nr:hypothetical protein LTR37_013558 [Vermiconidia calcicola]